MSLEIQPILDEISTLLEQPSLADVGFWEQILEPQNLVILKQAIVAREAAVVEQQVDYSTKISQLLTSDEPSDWQTAIELLHSLDDDSTVCFESFRSFFQTAAVDGNMFLHKGPVGPWTCP